MQASNRVREDVGKVAVMRGPTVYCAEEVDNQAPLWLYEVPSDAKISVADAVEELPGATVLKADALRGVEDRDGDVLYHPVKETSVEPAVLTLVPYYSWANRADGQMQVWFRS
jgi:DUF1680 family protein